MLVIESRLKAKVKAEGPNSLQLKCFSLLYQKLNGTDPLLYAAQKAIGPRQLNDEEARDTARRAYQNNPKLSSENPTFQEKVILHFLKDSSD
ncbi:MAG: hypothetical protein JW927_20810 [Deltaproteobacteria bacterium]|nr:hypothetical protein [Deltaproteobacteria bacterium]